MRATVALLYAALAVMVRWLG